MADQPLMNLTQLLQEKLLLDLPPVGLAFVDGPPDGVMEMGKEPPSFCTLWRWGETAVFYAGREHHLGCLVGGMVSGVPLGPGQLDEVWQLMEEMCRAEDPSAGSGQAVPSDEPERVPRVQRPWRGIVYGPLWRFPLEPDLALLWLTIVQAGVLQDVAGRVLWRGNPEGANFTRPACSVLPIAMERERPALSLGCVGMRAYTQLPPELCLLAVPGPALSRLEHQLQEIEDPEARIQAYLDKLRAAGMG
jgi:uncharacterized protein (DUF169 family)